VHPDDPVDFDSIECPRVGRLAGGTGLSVVGQLVLIVVGQLAAVVVVGGVPSDDVTPCDQAESDQCTRVKPQNLFRFVVLLQCILPGQSVAESRNAFPGVSKYRRDMLLRDLRNDIDETRRELSKHAENVAVSVENAAVAITLVGLVAAVAILLAGYTLATSGVKPPW
jgi:hypothetical protein